MRRPRRSPAPRSGSGFATGVSSATGSRAVIDEELDLLREQFGDEVYDRSRAAEAREIFEQVALGEDFVEFLTLPAYDYLDEEGDTDG